MHISLLVAVVLPSVLLQYSALAWMQCEDSADGICPDSNTCCGSGDSVGCISSKPGHGGTCCDSETGCGYGYTCATEPNKEFCQQTDPSDHSLPDRLPRYRQCAVPRPVLQITHGFPVEGRHTSHLGYLSTMGAIDSPKVQDLERHAHVETAVIVVHGSGRNADDYICCTSAALPRGAKNTSSFMVIAPWFLARQDNVHLVETANGTQVPPLVWQEYGTIFHTWRYGADDFDDNGISSYTAMDAIVNHLVADTVRFPRLRRIVVTGHSAGGQFTQRWALLSSSTAFYSSSRLSIRVVVANPKSFCFLDSRRFFNGTFREPTSVEIKECRLYNEWEWGLAKGDYLLTPYKDRAIAEVEGVRQLVHRYASRDVVYLAGGKDVLPNGNCMANMQGGFRRERSKNFHQSLREVFGYSVHRRVVVNDVHHDHCLMFQSPEGRQAMFEEYFAADSEQ